MRRLPSLPILIIVALSSTVVALIAQHLFGKSPLTIAVGPITAILLGILVSISKAFYR